MILFGQTWMVAAKTLIMGDQIVILYISNVYIRIQYIFGKGVGKC